MSLASVCGESGLSVTMSTPYSAAAALMREYLAAAVIANGPLMQWPTQPSGPSFALSCPSRNAIMPAVSSMTAVFVRLCMAARMTADICSLRRGMSKRSVPSR